jgi:hypothetical protein
MLIIGCDFHTRQVPRKLDCQFLKTPGRSNKQTFSFLTNHNHAKGAPGSGVWNLGLGVAFSFRSRTSMLTGPGSPPQPSQLLHLQPFGLIK